MEKFTHSARHKLTQACDFCRRRKMKCDGQYPRCSNCNTRMLSCTYLTTTKRRGPRSERIQELENKVDELEKLIMLKDIKDKGSNSLNLKDLGSEQEPDYTLPEFEVMENLINLYYSVVNPSIRFIHRETLMSSIDNSTNKKDKFKRPYLILNAIFALTARFSSNHKVLSNCEESSTKKYLIGDIFARRLWTHLTPTLFSQPTLETVQALILLGLHEYGKMKGFMSWNLIGIAIKLAQQLGLHMIDSYHNKDTFVHRPNSEDWLVTECKRRTWWGCFIADRFASSLVGRSLIIDERDCLVRLPSGDAQWDYRFGIVSQLPPDSANELSDFGADLTGADSVFCDLSAHFIQLIDLNGKVTRYLILRNARGTTYDADYTELEKLDSALLGWLHKLPRKFHNPKDFLAMQSDKFDGDGSDLFRTVACMFAMYHSTVITLHRGNLAHAQQSPDAGAMLRSSKLICLRSANQIADLLNCSWHRLDDMADPYYPYALFNAATIHTNCFHLEPTGTQQSKLSEQAFIQCSTALKYLSNIWLMSKTYLIMLDTLTQTLKSATQLDVSSQLPLPPNEFQFLPTDLTSKPNFEPNQPPPPTPSPYFETYRNENDTNAVPHHPNNANPNPVQYPLNTPFPSPRMTPQPNPSADGGVALLMQMLQTNNNHPTRYNASFEPITERLWEVFPVSYFDWFFAITTNK